MNFTQASEKDKSEILALYRSLAGTEFCAWTEEYPGEIDIEGDLSRDPLTSASKYRSALRMKREKSQV